MCVLSIKVPIQKKKSGNLFNDPRINLHELSNVTGILVEGQ